MNEIESLFHEVIEYNKGIDIKDIILDKSYLLDVHNNTVYNNIIIQYYERLRDELTCHVGVKSSIISNVTIDSIKKCNKFFTINRYDFNMIKDFISTNLCHSKFCNNCKKVKQASRMSRYIPELKPYKDNLYHIIFTLPNVKGSDLKFTLKNKMSNAFRKLMRYINGTKKLSFIDFSKYGYLGAIRSLEITFKDDNYHPHYHCAFAFKNLVMEKNITNVYSFDFKGNKDIRYFSEFEIILQKLWYMCLNDITVNKENYDNLELGYSVACNKFQDDDYAELFKYMTKETDEINNVLTYDNFKTLYFSSLFLKQIQGYGIFYRIDDSGIDNEVDIYYNDILYYLSQDEKPILQLERPFDLLNDNNYTIISRKKIYQCLRELDKK